ncbi:MAG: methyltransferase domain-containing protein [Anaerolineales bacterium]
MATVFMKWLETSPEKYQRGIEMLTLGRVTRIHQQIAAQYVRPGMQVLEIGCGTGALCVRMAQQGAQVTGIDLSPQMLGEASKNVAAEELEGQISLKLMDASLVGEVFSPGQFDLIVASFSLSEMQAAEQQYLLRSCHGLLAEGGKLLIADEVRPAGFLPRLLYTFVRLPLLLVTWLLTRTSTHPLEQVHETLERAGFQTDTKGQFLAGSLVLMEARPSSVPIPAGIVVGHLEHRVTWKTVLKDVVLLFNRLIPPYPKVQPGLYSVGKPGDHAPVLVTGNFDLTVRRLVQALDGRLDTWVLVVDTGGINVWCAAGGGFFTAEKVAAAMRVSRLEEVVSHHSLILPQLAACGVDGWKLRKQTGWGVHWGPVEAEDLPAYIASHYQKDLEMRLVSFPWKARLEMVTVTLSFYALMILLPVLIFWRGLFWPVTLSLLGLSYFYAVVHPWLPGRDGLEKSVPLALLALGGYWAYLQFTPAFQPGTLFGWGIGLVGLSVFTAAEMQGMSPRMRGEQANWIIEGFVFAALGLLYWIVPMLAGWR